MIFEPLFQAARFRQDLLGWYHANKRDLPWRSLWLQHRDPYHIWLSEIMLQQTVIKAVVPVYLGFVAELPSVQQLAKADPEMVKRLCRGLGYYRRFRFLKLAAEQLSAQVPFAWPTTIHEWLKLPGVGEYTASAVASIVLGQPTAVIDGNVERVFCRLFNIQKPANLPAIKSNLKPVLAKLICPDSPGDFNQGLMELGQKICRPLSPLCDICPLANYCLAKKNATQHLAPKPKVRPERKAVDLTLSIVSVRGKIGLNIRPQNAKFLRDQLGFITGIADVNGSVLCDGEQKALSLVKSEFLGQFKHNITKHDLTVKVFFSESSTALPSMVWLKPVEIEERLIANLDRKAWRLYSTAIKP